MSIYKKEVKKLLINDPSQLVVLDGDGTPFVAGDFNAAGEDILMQGFIDRLLFEDLVLLAPATRIKVTAPTVAATQASTLTVAAPSSALQTVIDIRVLYEDLETPEVEYQNTRKIEKQFQVNLTGITTNTAAATAIANAINADPYLPFTATVAAAVITIVPDRAGLFILIADVPGLFAGTPTSGYGALATTVAPSKSYGTYNQLINYFFATPHNGSEFDRRSEYFPMKNASYRRYYFETLTTSNHLGSHFTSDQAPVQTRQGFELWVNVASASTLVTTLNLVATDCNI